MKIYTPPEEVGEPPKLDYTHDFQVELAKEDAWIEKVKEWAFTNGKGDMRGKEVSFPHADGYARYVVLSGTELIWLPVGDRWQFPYIERLKASDLRERIERKEKLDSIFSKKEEK